MALRRKYAEIATKASVDAAAKRRRSESEPVVGTSPAGAAPATSARQRKSLVAKEKERPEASDKVRAVIDEKTLEEIVQNMLCPSCAKDKVTVKFTHHQIDTYMCVACACGHVVVDTLKAAQVKERNYHPMTMLLVYCMMLLGVGYVGANKLVSFFSLKHFTKTTYIRYAKYIKENAVKHTRNVLERSRRAVREHYANKEDVEIVDDKLQANVTFDGSWHKRGFKSNFGAGAAVDVETGLILDYFVCSKICYKCISKKNALVNKKISETEYVFWLQDEHDDCDANYEGPSGGMEAAEAKEIWGRSGEHQMIYKTFVSDGDSSAYRAVCDMNGGAGPYGKDCKVVKAECVNHVAKRLGTGLRALKKTRGGAQKGKAATMGGRHKLTDTVIDHLQHYFQVSLNRKVHTSAEEMREEILSTFFHCTSTDENPQHDKCPKNENSWCFYNKSIARGETPPSHSKMKVYFHLGEAELQQVKAVYERLTSDELMTRCLQGMTQNRNEHLHSRIWRICPKHRNASKMIVDFACATAVCNYNVGYSASSLTGILGIESTLSMEKYLQTQDVAMDSPYRRKMRNNKIRRDLEYAAGKF